METLETAAKQLAHQFAGLVIDTLAFIESDGGEFNSEGEELLGNALIGLIKAIRESS